MFASDPFEIAADLVRYHDVCVSGLHLIVAGNSAKNMRVQRVFGDTAFRLFRESPLPLYLAQ